MEQWIMDARYAARRLRHRPLYAILAVLTLALGVGGTAAIFGITRAVLLEPLPYSHPEGVAVFWSPGDWNQQEYAFLRGNTPGMSAIAQTLPRAMTLELNNEPARLVPAVSTSHELFDILGVNPAIGRNFTSTDDVLGAAPVAIISDGLWHELGGTPSLLGSRIRLDGRFYTVIGVMPRGFWYPTPAERVWIPEPLQAEQRVGNYTLVGRVAPGMSLDNFSGPLAALTKQLGERFTYPPQWDKTRNASIKSAEEVSIRPLRPALIATLVAMAMILIIASANVAALMLGQIEGRTTELAVRSALGADRRRLTNQLIAESLLLGALAGVAGIAVATAAFHLIVTALPLGAWAESATLDWRVFAAAMVVSIGISLIISLFPVMGMNRRQLQGKLAAGRTSGVSGKMSLERWLVITEVAVAVLMAAGAGVLARSVARLYAIDPGFKTHGVGAISLVLPADLRDADRKRIVADLVEVARRVPGVASAGMVQFPPIRAPAWNSGLTVEGHPDLPSTTTMIRVITPGYFETMGVPVTSGRALATADISADSTAGRVVIVNRALADKFFPGVDPVGHWVSSGFADDQLRIIGVVENVKEGFLTGESPTVRYLPYTVLSFTSQTQTLMFKVTGNQDPVTLLGSVRRAITAAQPRVAIQQASTMDEELARAVGPVKQIMSLVTALTGLALLLGAIGIYGVMSHFVLRRRREWGIRMALGLKPTKVISSVLNNGLVLVGIGIGLGLVAFLFLGRLLAPLIYGVGAADPLAIALAALALLVVGLLGALVPAARASRTDPAAVLREY